MGFFFGHDHERRFRNGFSSFFLSHLEVVFLDVLGCDGLLSGVLLLEIFLVAHDKLAE